MDAGDGDGGISENADGRIRKEDFSLGLRTSDQASTSHRTQQAYRKTSASPSKSGSLDTAAVAAAAAAKATPKLMMKELSTTAVGSFPLLFHFRSSSPFTQITSKDHQKRSREKRRQLITLLTRGRKERRRHLENDRKKGLTRSPRR